MKKKKPQNNPPKQKEFHAAPFSALKGVAVSPVPPAEPEKYRPAPPTVNEEDDPGLFIEAMGNVRPLDGRNHAASAVRKKALDPSAPTRPEMAGQAESEAFAQAIRQLKLDVTFSEKFPDDEIKPLGANRLRQLKKGVIQVDRQLDLHGLTREEALFALPRFLQNARFHGAKAVLVITGKGINSPDEPVLQQAIAAWLRDAGKDYVVEFAPAPRDMGGSGAFVLFLRTLPA